VSAGRPYVKDGLTAVTPFLLVPDIAAASAFYVRVFGAVEIRRDPDAAGVAQHAVLRIDEAPIELGRHAVTARSDLNVLPALGVHLFVPDVDAVYERAVAAGAAAKPPVDMPYGDREAAIVDPFGVTWWVATNRSGTTKS
jgi:uncharacterized glyoxalase superfamily protein PhnB